MQSVWKCDISCFSETRLRSDLTPDNSLGLNGNTIFRRDWSARRGGGLLQVLVYVYDQIKARRRLDLEKENIECIALDLKLDVHTRCLLLSCYRAPNFNVNPDHYFNALCNILAELESTKPQMLILLGDFNAKHNLWDPSSNPNPAGHRLFSLLNDFSLSQLSLVGQPTRYASDSSSSSTLDLVATNRQDLITQVEISDPFSDHCPVATELELPRKTHTQRTLLVPNYKQADWEGFRQNLFHSPLLEAIQGTSDVDAAWKVWSDLF